MENDAVSSPEYPSDFDQSFTSSTTFTLNSSSSPSSRNQSFNGRNLSFTDRLSTVSAPSTTISTSHPRPHRKHDPHWTSITTATNLSPDNRLHLSHLKLLRRLGSGDLGHVFLCQIRDFPSSSHFALKVVDRDSLSSKKLSQSDTEAKILSDLDHPFLPTLYAHINASHYTCLLIDYCPGGDLNSLLRRQPRGRFPLSAVRFYASEILIALEYLHSKGIVYRDLKPENILIRSDGHIMLSDFDLCFTADVNPRIESDCFVAEPTSAYSTSCVGTHEYLSPELINGNGHGNGVDWWGFGILIHELLYGTTPFKGISKEETLRNIAFGGDVEFSGNCGSETKEVRDLIRRLLVKDPERRLGCLRGAADVKLHPFFKEVKWPLIRSYKPPEMEVKRRRWWSRSVRYVLKKSKVGLKLLKDSGSGNSYVSIKKTV